MTIRDAVKSLEKAGGELVNVKGSHATFRMPGGAKIVMTGIQSPNRSLNHRQEKAVRDVLGAGPVAGRSLGKQRT